MSILSAVQNEKWTQKINFDMKIMPWHAMVKMVISIITVSIYSIYALLHTISKNVLTCLQSAT